jgi:bifunctional UDP-N-acetylglucosamine pyrophosphorylase/glucosamine-1-phosphate N-acetyltransferase/UDP-N-acetylglucosamine pyrophosphorylase
MKKSDRPKVLAEACGRPLIHYVLEALARAGIQRHVVVIGYRGEDVQAALAGFPGVEYAVQAERRGTGHAVMMCRAQLAAHHGPSVVVTGDSPLLQAASLNQLLSEFARAPRGCVLGTLLHDNPAGLGRIVRDPAQNFLGIVEDKDASDSQRQIREVNMSTYVFASQDLLGALDQLTDSNRQREYYITDVPQIQRQAGLPVRALPVLRPCEAFSVNTLEDLQRVEEEIRRGAIEA